MKFLELIKSGSIKEAYELLTPKKGVENNAKEFNNNREIRETQVGKRPIKTTKDGDVRVSRIPIPFQRQIVKTAATFLFGSSVKLVERKSKEDTTEDGEAFKAISDLWDDLRIDPMLLKFCKAVKSETEASIIFYPVKKEGDTETKIKARLITSENGKVYPVFDAFGDMVAFGWEYLTKEDDKDVSYLYIFTAETNYVFRKESKEWEVSEGYPKPNLFKKIPVVYLSQKHPEWWEVQEMIDTFEMSFSKFVDTNGYFASPMYKATGALKSFPKKDDTGKLVKLDIIETDKGNVIQSDLDVISWDRAPEALKLEFETNKGLIYGLTDTPDLSFDNVKGIGNISGIALKLMFLGPILNAKEGEGDYQIAISRIINLMKTGITNITNTGLSKKLEDLRIDVTFTSVLPENIKEVIEILSEATGGKPIMSQKTATAQNPLVEDVEEEMSNIEEESVLELGDTVE
ncbi:phage portal protein [Formosa sp. Hel1_33_131]|uniref:phage portal protein n=1 Tax=Formosa sp. Hel1_33_131 TaxID=1336794 RepID=UPI00084E146F|nr:phage portal protein [Formosa sp. Hel1_33_131]AOR28739.1 phage portal protein [Formosa sp. Hel1_33_131]